jgi:hypothetical protein
VKLRLRVGDTDVGSDPMPMAFAVDQRGGQPAACDSCFPNHESDFIRSVLREFETDHAVLMYSKNLRLFFTQNPTTESEQCRTDCTQAHSSRELRGG